jgi:nicotinic acid mononucleotide adenylyltransferase
MTRELIDRVEKYGRFKNVVWEGRYQPIHLGHVAYVRELLKYGERVWIWVVANEQSSEVISDVEELVVPEFTQTVDPHHRPEKNLLPFWLRYRLVVETLQSEFGAEAPITVSGGRRLDLAWDLYRKILPPERIFITPERDSFEDVKAAAWQKLGEECYRMDVSHLPRISATMIRDRIRNKQPVDDLLPHYAVKLLREEGYIEDLARL